MSISNSLTHAFSVDSESALLVYAGILAPGALIWGGWSWYESQQYGKCTYYYKGDHGEKKMTDRTENNEKCTTKYNEGQRVANYVGGTLTMINVVVVLCVLYYLYIWKPNNLLKKGLVMKSTLP